MKKSALIKTVSFILAFTLVLCVVTVPTQAIAEQLFEDVPETHWAAHHIVRAYKEGWVTGTYNTPEKKLFSPNTVLTTAEWCAVVSNMAYPGEKEFFLDDSISDPRYLYSSAPWYAVHAAILYDFGILTGLDSLDFTGPITREAVGQMIYNVAQAKLVYEPTEAELSAAQARIKDYDQISPAYRDAMKAVVTWGVISGDESGNVNPKGQLTRAEMAAIACKMYDLILNRPEIGSISDEPVTLSLTTHHWVTDYSAQVSPELLDNMDRDAFNCAVQTARDYWKIRFDGDVHPQVKGYATVINDYYNYACYSGVERTREIQNVMDVAQESGLLNIGAEKDPNGGSCWFFTANDSTKDEQRTTAEVRSIIDQITKTMTDREVVLLCIKAVVDKLDYQVDGGASWYNGKTVGDCENYSSMIEHLLRVAGIPVFDVGNNNHDWLQARIDGEWYVVDGTTAETWNSYEAGIWTIEEYAKLVGNDSLKKSNNLFYRRVRALASYIPERSEMYRYTDSYF